LPTSYIKPPFAFPAPKEKHECISASVQTEKNLKIKNFASTRTHLRVRTDNKINK
jgi:hypothetical protein